MNSPLPFNNFLFWPFTNPLLWKLFEIYLNPDDTLESQLENWQKQFDEQINSFSNFLSKNNLTELEDETYNVFLQPFVYAYQFFCRAIEYFKTEYKSTDRPTLNIYYLLDMWLRCCEKAFQELLSNSSYQEFFGKAINAWVSEQKNFNKV